MESKDTTLVDPLLDEFASVFNVGALDVVNVQSADDDDEKSPNIKAEDGDSLDELASLLAGCTVDVQSTDGDDKKFIVMNDKDCMDLLDRIEASAQKKLTEAIHDYHIEAQMEERS